MKKFTDRQVIVYGLVMWLSGICLGIGGVAVVADIKVQYKYFQQSSECVAGYVSEGFERSSISMDVAGSCWLN